MSGRLTLTDDQKETVAYGLLGLCIGIYAGAVLKRLDTLIVGQVEAANRDALLRLHGGMLLLVRQADQESEPYDCTCGEPTKLGWMHRRAEYGACYQVGQPDYENRAVPGVTDVPNE